MVLMTVNKIVIKNKADIHPEDTVKFLTPLKTFPNTQKTIF